MGATSGLGYLVRIIRRGLWDLLGDRNSPLREYLLPSFLDPLSSNYMNENDLIRMLYDSLSNLSQRGPIPLGSVGGYDLSVLVRSCITHKRIVHFTTSCSNPPRTKPVGAETSDISFLVTYKYYSRSGEYDLSEKVTFIQLKVGRPGQQALGMWDIKLNQLILMTEWPVFLYGRACYDPKECRLSPDLCSFYLLLRSGSEYTERLCSYRGLRGNQQLQGAPCMLRKTRDLAVSAILVRGWIESADGKNLQKIFCDGADFRKFSPFGSPEFGPLSLIQNVIWQYIGVSCEETSRFLKKIFPELFNDFYSEANGGTSDGYRWKDVGYSLGVHIILKLKRLE